VTAQLRSELRKMQTTRTNAGLLLGLVALILFGVIAGSFAGTTDLSLVEDQRSLIGNGAYAAAFAALIGLMAFTSEVRHGTLRATFVFTADRTLVVLAKALASILVGIAFGAFGSMLSLATGTLMIRARGHELLIDSGDVRRIVLGTIVMSALWAAAGVGIGALLRNQVLAIVCVLTWVFVVESLLFELVPGLARFMPGVAGTAMTGATVGDSTVDLLPAVAGGAVLAGYAALFVLAGTLVTNRRDVT
jgi:ABC-2 type transport system permease protein